MAETNMENKDEAPIAIAIHGGAGTITKANLSDEKEAKIRAKLDEALSAGYQALEQGKSSIEAVQTAITILENSPLFNAGVGAVYTFNGEHELDASIMDGRTLQAGAIAGVKRIKNPIQLAAQVLSHSRHVLLTGEGAEEFAATRGIKFADNRMFDTQFRYEAWQKAKTKHEQDKQAFWSQWPDYKYGTVGAVALDSEGNIAAGTSTGGMTLKQYGRVGDSPIIGAGTYANNESCAVSATGHGEFFIRYNVAADICARVKYSGKSIKAASNEVINDVLKNAGGSGGVIVLDAKGHVALPFNTEGMYRASINAKGEKYIGIYK
ncbi:isoaspartyl peptidase/L-asparaginase [Alteromonas sp. a30]|nr:isoaspartyl peptidase/L-asparaginase [Alteromonas sp. a30]MCY7296394.1 isoaspartyl peptidase/L-asparaginase [Alteromonas sp. a30]